MEVDKPDRTEEELKEAVDRLQAAETAGHIPPALLPHIKLLIEVAMRREREKVQDVLSGGVEADESSETIASLLKRKGMAVPVSISKAPEDSIYNAPIGELCHLTNDEAIKRRFPNKVINRLCEYLTRLGLEHVLKPIGPQAERRIARITGESAPARERNAPKRTSRKAKEAELEAVDLKALTIDELVERDETVYTELEKAARNYADLVVAMAKGKGVAIKDHEIDLLFSPTYLPSTSNPSIGFEVASELARCLKKAFPERVKIENEKERANPATIIVPTTPFKKPELDQKISQAVALLAEVGNEYKRRFDELLRAKHFATLEAETPNMRSTFPTRGGTMYFTILGAEKGKLDDIIVRLNAAFNNIYFEESTNGCIRGTVPIKAFKPKA